MVRALDSVKVDPLVAANVKRVKRESRSLEQSFTEQNKLFYCSDSQGRDQDGLLSHSDGLTGASL
jgi:hypothetical protein